MHPIEQLRYVAGAAGADPTMVAIEAANAVRFLDERSLVVSSRQLIRRHPTNGQLWWVCSHLLSAGGSSDVSRRLVHELEGDTTASALASALPADATVLTTGRAGVLADGFTRRGDVSVIVAGQRHDADRLARALRRRDVDVEQIEMEEAAWRAGDGVDVVVIEAEALTSTTVFASMGAAVLTAVAGVVGLPVWVVAPRGIRLPDAYRSCIDDLVSGADQEQHDVVAPGQCARVVGPDGAVATSSVAFAAECAPVAALLSSSS